MQQGVSDVDALREGAWVVLEDGGWLWSWTLLSADAPSHMLLFECVPHILHATLPPSTPFEGCLRQGCG